MRPLGFYASARGVSLAAGLSSLCACQAAGPDEANAGVDIWVMAERKTTKRERGSTETPSGLLVENVSTKSI